MLSPRQRVQPQCWPGRRPFSQGFANGRRPRMGQRLAGLRGVCADVCYMRVYCWHMASSQVPLPGPCARWALAEDPPRPAAACRCPPRVRWALAEDPPRSAAMCRCPPHDRWALVEDWWRPGRRWWRCACTCQALPGVTTLPPGWAALGHAVAGARARGGPAAARSLTAKLAARARAFFIPLGGRREVTFPGHYHLRA